MSEPIAIQDTLEYQILQMWQKCIDGAADFEVPIGAVQELIASTRRIMTEANWPAIYQHNFFVGLKKTLGSHTPGHPTTLQIVRLLEIETEFS